MSTLIPKYTKVTTANRTIAEKFAETISVKDFGAVGNAAADDTAAIQAAINYCQTSTAALFIPQGTYKVTSTLTAVNAMKIYGEWGLKDTGSSVIEYTGTGDCLILGDTTSQSFSPPYHKYGFDISNLQIIGTAGTGNGINIYNASGNYSNLYVRSFDGYSILCQQGFASSFQNVTTHYSTLGGLWVNNLGGALALINCSFLSHGKGLKFGNTAPFSGGIYSVEVIGCDFEGCTYGVYFGNDTDATFDEVTSVMFDTIHFESNTNNFYSTSQCYLWGCSFNNTNFSDATSTFKSRMYNCTMSSPLFFGTSALACTSAVVQGLVVINPAFYTGYSGAGITGAGTIGTFIGTAGNIPTGALLVGTDYPGIMYGSAYSYIAANHLSAEQTASGVVSFTGTQSSTYNVQVNEVAAAVTINFTDNNSKGANLVLYIQTNNGGSLTKTVTITSTDQPFKGVAAFTTPSATTKVNVYSFTKTLSGWLETSRITGLDI
jgi:hypothetical protein